MLGEDLDIGFYAEDAYAAYVAQLATELHITPTFRNARGATLEAVFAGPFLSLSVFREAVTAAVQPTSKPAVSAATTALSSSSSLPDEPVWERLARMSKTSHRNTREERAVVVLHAWIEKLNEARTVQLTEQVYPAADSFLSCVSEAEQGKGHKNVTGGDPDVDGGASAEVREHYRVLGTLDFLLHLSARDIPVGDSGTSAQSPGLDTFEATSLPQSPPTELVRVAPAPQLDLVTQRDDVALARHAADTLLQFARMAEEHPGEVATVHLDTKRDLEYVQFAEET